MHKNKKGIQSHAKMPLSYGQPTFDLSVCLCVTVCCSCPRLHEEAPRCFCVAGFSVHSLLHGTGTLSTLA